MSESKRRGRPPEPKSDLQDIVDLENVSASIQSKSELIKKHMQDASQTPQDAPQWAFIDVEEAVQRLIQNKTSEVLLKQFATDTEGTWTPFDMIWISFPTRPLKFRKPTYNNESTDRREIGEIPLPHNGTNPDAPSHV